MTNLDKICSTDHRFIQKRNTTYKMGTLLTNFQRISEFLCTLTDFSHFSDMRRDVQEIFRNTPHEKQVCMFSATLSKEIRPVCKKFMQDVGIYDRNYYWGKVK